MKCLRCDEFLKQGYKAFAVHLANDREHSTGEKNAIECICGVVVKSIVAAQDLWKPVKLYNEGDKIKHKHFQDCPIISPRIDYEDVMEPMNEWNKNDKPAG